MPENMKKFTPDERAKLAASFQKVVEKHQAEKLGVAHEELGKRIINGQARWVKKAALYTDMEKQRSIAAVKKPVRVLRDGENSLARKISSLLEGIGSQLEDLAGQNLISSMEKLDLRRSVNNLQQRVEKHIAELEKIESTIEQEKSRDPLFAEADAVLQELYRCKTDGNASRFASLQQTHAELLKKYENRRKSLMPYIVSARHERFILQKEFWRLMQIQWDLQVRALAQGVKQFGSLVKDLSSEDLQCAHEHESMILQDQLDQLDQRKNELAAQIPPNDAPPQEGSKRWDQTLPVMETMLEEQAFLLQTLQARVQEYTTEALPSGESSRRMAFADRNKR